jgi:uncharacterized LabA/DUF88 family protein
MSDNEQLRLFEGTEDLTTAILIDGINSHYAWKSLNWMPDYKRMLDYFKRVVILKKIYYFVSLDKDQEENSIIRLIDWLDYNGFICKVTDTDERGRGIQVDFTVQAMKLVPAVDHFILFTGNSQFVPLVKYLDDAGKIVTICSTLLNQKMVSDDLRRAADNFVEINDLREHIEKKDAAFASEAA